MKPVLNAKLGLITEGVYSPSVALGFMEWSPSVSSMDFTYLSMTKTLRSNPDTFSYGRVTIGLGFNAGSRALFSGTWPFQENSRVAPLLAYESPILAKRLGFVADYLGGASEISDLYLGATWAVSGTTTFAAGAFVSNDRANASDGFFTSLNAAFDLTKEPQ